MGVWGGGGVCYTHTYTHTHSTVYIFDPSSPTPLAVHGSVCSEHVIGAVFVPLGSAMEDRDSDPKSKLYFMNRHQVGIDEDYVLLPLQKFG